MDDDWEAKVGSAGKHGAGGSGGQEEDQHWSQSSFKRFDWDAGVEDVWSSADTSRSMLEMSADDVVFEDAISSTFSTRALEARVKEVANQLATVEPIQEKTLSNQLEESGKLEVDLVNARKKIDFLQNLRYQADPSVTTIQNIILGKPFSLEGYKSLKKKEDLLDCALEMGDGDAILAVTLMIKRSLNHPRFLSLVSSRPSAANHLINYMITRHEMSQVIDLLHALGKFEYAGVISYRQATARGTHDDKVRKLKKLLHTQMSGHDDSGLVMEQINILERISPLISGESEYGDRQVSNLSGSVLLALSYLSTWYYTAPDNLLHSPSALIKMHKLTRTQATWVTVRARASVQAWKDCEILLVGKGWMGGIKAKGDVDIVEMATVLHDAKCPTETLSLILQAIESPSDRLDLARKLGATRVVVDVMLAQKDRVALQGYRDSLTRNSDSWTVAEEALSRSNIKWKN